MIILNILSLFDRTEISNLNERKNKVSIAERRNLCKQDLICIVDAIYVIIILQMASGDRRRTEFDYYSNTDSISIAIRIARITVFP